MHDNVPPRKRHEVSIDCDVCHVNGRRIGDLCLALVQVLLLRRFLRELEGVSWL